MKTLFFKVLTMNSVNKKHTNGRQVFKQLLNSTLLIMAIMSFASAQELTLSALDPYAKAPVRHPSNFVPADDIEPTPYFENKLWVEKAFVADNEGVLNGMKSQIQSWQDTEEYAKNWNVYSTGLYNTPESESRKKMLSSGFLKYADKRLAGEMKDAEEGSTMATMSKAHQALRPQANVGVSQNVKIKFRAKALQGEGKVIVENPWLEYETKYKVFNNNLSTSAGKSFKTIGFRASADYQVTDKNWAANFDQKLTEKWSTRLTSAQTNKEMAFSSESNRIIQLLFSQGW